MECDVAIVGGGPGGLSAAAALRQVLPPDVRIKVFEANTRFTEAGAGVGMRVNGMRALEAISPYAAHGLYERGCYSRCIRTYKDSDGEEVSGSAVPTDHAGNLERLGHSSVLAYWNDLRRVVADCLPPGVVEFGCRLSGCEALPLEGGAGQQELPESAPMAEQPYRYQLTFERPSSGAGHSGGPSGGEEHVEAGGLAAAAAPGRPPLAVRCKVVVGADGYFSRVRRELLDGQAPAFTGMLMWRGSFPPEQLAAAEAGGEGLPLPGALAGRPAARAESHRWVPEGAYGLPGAPGVNPRLVLMLLQEGGEGVGVWYMQMLAPEAAAAGVEWPPAGSSGGGLYGEAALRRGLTAFAHLPPDLRALLGATRPERVTEHGLYTHALDKQGPGSWTRGHVAILGDAAHAAPPDGQGANLSIEDAVVLATVARKHGGVLGPQVFSEWEALRQPRVRTILGDAAPPFAVRTAAINAATFEPLWRPSQLGGEAAAVAAAAGADVDGEAGVQRVLSWSRGVIRAIVERRLAELAVMEGAAAAAPAEVAAAAKARVPA
ncbi:hypothetical protein HYH03_012816 [Edaphochlamys debaryana]|uniref:FAD-binding domain-containing protein n=1 Tax=Edaphochlamys debaryana TaxID=47281 RepID=A0A835XTD0_9CHLO|nr:hypothetical protein HYH03_012816 [Edaphochlamys debaryana]|eukprot:KAG2488648.1 hypothetical protein HYH03_012816 [Edaphochlamys debaryana]